MDNSPSSTDGPFTCAYFLRSFLPYHSSPLCFKLVGLLVFMRSSTSLAPLKSVLILQVTNKKSILTSQIVHRGAPSWQACGALRVVGANDPASLLQSFLPTPCPPLRSLSRPHTLVYGKQNELMGISLGYSGSMVVSDLRAPLCHMADIQRPPKLVSGFSTNLQKLQGDIFHVTLLVPMDFHWRSGQHCWLRMPHLSPFQNHPFTM